MKSNSQGLGFFDDAKVRCEYRARKPINTALTKRALFLFIASLNGNPMALIP